MFAAVHDLEARLRTDLDAAQAEAVLQGASDEIRATCAEWQLDLVEDDAVTLEGNGSRRMLLPMPPVESVAEVVDEDGEPVEGWTLRGETLELDSARWAAGRLYTVTYTHGFGEVPDVVREMTLRLAARMWVNPEFVMQKRRGEFSVSFGSSTREVSGLTSHELRLLARRGLRRSSR